MKSEEIIRLLVNQNQMLFAHLLDLTKVIAEKQSNHDKVHDMMKSLINDEGVFDPFKGMDDEMKKGFANALKHAPDIASVLKKEQDKEEERMREWKEKLKGNK